MHASSSREWKSTDNVRALLTLAYIPTFSTAMANTQTTSTGVLAGSVAGAVAVLLVVAAVVILVVR